MQCERCGADIPDESSFCGQCGAPKPAQQTISEATPGAQPVQEAAPAVLEAPAQPAETSERSTGRTCLWIGVGCAGLMAISLCAVLAFAFPFVSSLLQDIDLTDIEALATVVAEFSEIGDLEQDLLDLPDAPEPTEAPEPDVCFNILCFSYPEGEDYGADSSVLPAELEMEWWAVPEHDDFTFYDYPLSDTFHKAHISIYQVAEFLDVNPSAEEMVAELESFLAEQPDDPENVPFVLPIFNAGQLLIVQVEYLPFESGSGVRFVSQYGQAAWPINNQDIFYAFQGLTDDGNYIISAVLPVTHPSLPADGETFIGDEYEAFINAYDAYILEVEGHMDLENPESFFPELTALDEMLESLQIEVP
ncbi:MAG: zinc ribbon domain-containing protein [Anaerolineales bacterium]|nr:zinc ribbon domain-containing protein [Anaerolineales bacterium]